MKKDINFLDSDRTLIMHGIPVKFTEETIAYFKGCTLIEGKPADIVFELGDEFEKFTFDQIRSSQPDGWNWNEGYVYVQAASGNTEWWDGIPYSYELAPLSDIDAPRCITDLSREELMDMGKYIAFGSMYLSDFNNGYFVPRDEVCSYVEGYMDSLEGDETPTAEGFADYILYSE